ncbi:hypothetical protein SAMN00768000_0293 [Sulfobacillus thermosulfidooxidans DSM 9293]|uniref:Uncharacterized protein n=1 Tax=Sulfobacillus thermosulfidooxidans (strain DSM 9293 / VKM B-1269 / AT-1) TaxID=929705 RepID=A0A1W1W7B0_SULTA|nr:hypothetical protein [Sulfobacillus thermosulfidooxidans]SMC02082.1 hypothetical protein SAMN00768000_0293 [Sulfobacillus thermosulfidooxidans DSM 9293]
MPNLCPDFPAKHRWQAHVTVVQSRHRKTPGGRFNPLILDQSWRVDLEPLGA